MGFKLSGTVELRPRAVRIEVRVPLALRMFQGRVKASLDREARRFIADAHQKRTGAAPA
jgi:hypothetical protein